MKKTEKKAVWVIRTHLLRADEIVCSRCGRAVPRPVPVCPGCGTRMEGKEKDLNWVDEAFLLDMLLDD